MRAKLAVLCTILSAPAMAQQNVGGITTEVCTTPTVTAGAYSAGNEVGGLMTFPNVGRTIPAGFFNAPGLTGVLQSVRLTVKSLQTAEFDITFFSTNPSNTTWADKLTPMINSADVAAVQPPIKLTNYFSGLGTTYTVYGADGIGRAIKLASTSLYGIITTPGTPTFNSTSDVQLCASILQD